jgi:hypothetical protein
MNVETWLPWLNLAASTVVAPLVILRVQSRERHRETIRSEIIDVYDEAINYALKIHSAILSRTTLPGTPTDLKEKLIRAGAPAQAYGQFCAIESTTEFLAKLSARTELMTASLPSPQELQLATEKQRQAIREAERLLPNLIYEGDALISSMVADFVEILQRELGREWRATRDSLERELTLARHRSTKALTEGDTRLEAE